MLESLVELLAYVDGLQVFQIDWILQSLSCRPTIYTFGSEHFLHRGRIWLRNSGRTENIVRRGDSEWTGSPLVCGLAALASYGPILLLVATLLCFARHVQGAQVGEKATTWGRCRGRLCSHEIGGITCHCGLRVDDWSLLLA